MLRKLFFAGCVGFVLLMQLANFSGCVKEYSFEGSPFDTIPTDSIPDDTATNKLIFPYCTGCDGKDDYIFDSWNFKYDTSFFCGSITRGIIEPEHRMAFTFFGPSSCSADTGLIMTVYLDVPLNADVSNITVHHVIFQYYNNLDTQQDIFVSSDLRPFTLFIEQYTQSTGIIKGSFSGFVDTDRNTVVEIKNGKFVVHFT